MKLKKNQNQSSSNSKKSNIDEYVDSESIAEVKVTEDELLSLMQDKGLRPLTNSEKRMFGEIFLDEINELLYGKNSNLINKIIHAIRPWEGINTQGMRKQSNH